MQILDRVKFMFLLFWKGFFSTQNVHKHVFLVLLAKKEGRRNLKMIVFDRKDSPKKTFQDYYCPRREKKKKAIF